MKARITLVATYEYEIDPKNYKEGLSYEDMLKVDIMSAEDDPLFLFEDIDIEVTGTLIQPGEESA